MEAAAYGFSGGRLQPFYRSSGFCSLQSQPHPRLDLLKKEHYWTVNCVQATRGCPFSCDFCSVAQFFGDTYRYRPVDEVIEEVKQLPSGGTSPLSMTTSWAGCIRQGAVSKACPAQEDMDEPGQPDHGQGYRAPENGRRKRLLCTVRGHRVSYPGQPCRHE